jgi:carboxyl-terminal processing protease
VSIRSLLRKFVIKGLMIASSCVWIGSAYALSIEPTQEDSILAQMITRELERRHLASDALFAERKPMVGQLILKAIDPSRSLLTQDDIRQADIDRLPDQIERGRLNTVYQLYGLSLTRSEERLDYWLDILNQGVGSIDLSDQEELRIRDEETPWVSDLTSLKDLWRKQLENQAIGLLLADRTEDETYKALIRRYNSQKNRIEQTRPDDIFAGVINAYASAYDPHTSYLPPADSETFNINMSLSLQGIGAVLQSEDEFTKVVSLIPGGPAEMDGRLKPADRILSIAQGSQPFEDVVGWRLDEVVQKIRGPKGSQVRLEVQAGDDVPHREIVLIRDRVQLEEQSAKSQIIEAGKNGEKIGIITIPTFYSDFTAKQAGDPNYRSTTRDVKKLLEELRNQDVQGVIVDLRNNGGGSLQEAYELFGLFIPRGPVVQIRSAGGRTDVRGDRDPEVSWEGPMAVLVNRLSASASEIFAGAVQDYGRGLVIGSQTFGKGTVQALLPVNEGQLKLTIAKFYRISGQSTQHQGVIPDIQFPSAFDPKEIGESALDTALPWDQIRSLRYRPLDTPQARVAQLIDRHQARIATDPNFKALLKRTERALELSSETGISLHLATRIKEREDNNQALLDIENARRTGLGLPTIESISELESDGKEADPKDDASLMESARILLDEIQINPRLAGL